MNANGSVPECFHDGIGYFGLPSINLIISSVRMSSIVHDDKGDILIFVSPSHDTSRAVVTETVRHLGTRTTGAEAIAVGVVVGHAFDPCGEQLYGGFVYDAGELAWNFAA